MTGGASPDSDTAPRWYGRRHGHRLRKGARERLRTLLPRLRVPVPPDGRRLDMADLFPAPVDDVWLEVGFGAGEHLAAQARANPRVGLIGCEPFVNGVAALLGRIEAEGLTNVRIFDDDARLLLDALPDGALGRVFALFSDPWPKRRHHRRRFIAPATVETLARLLRDGGELRVASDHMGYVAWTLEHLARHPHFMWQARSRADWERRPDDWFETRYEAKALARGATCVYLGFRRLPRG